MRSCICAGSKPPPGPPRPRRSCLDCSSWATSSLALNAITAAMPAITNICFNFIVTVLLLRFWLCWKYRAARPRFHTHVNSPYARHVPSQNKHDSSIAAEETAQQLLNQDFQRASFARLEECPTAKKNRLRRDKALAAGG